MRMSSDEYAAFVDSLSPRSPIWGDLLRAGLVGGAICTLGQALTDLYTACGAAAGPRPAPAYARPAPPHSAAGTAVP